MSRLISDCHPDLQPLLQKFLADCALAGIRVGISETYRSTEEQDEDYAKGRTAPGHIITNAKGGQSPHNVVLSDGTPAACAFDFYILYLGGTLDWDASDPAWQKAIAIGEGLGLVSGSEWHSIKDNPHMELKDWKTIDLTPPTSA